jgi:molybdenum cofactor cytidylyltransferase
LIVGILLAAGRSRRFGEDKLLYPLPDGTPMGVASAHVLRESLGRIVVVVSARYSPLGQLLQREGTTIAVCNNADEGMGASLACGVRAASEATGWVIALADMPYIQAASVRRVAEALRKGAPLAAPMYKGRRGHPVGFSHQFYSALTALDGDLGARPVLAEYGEQLVSVDVDDAGVLHDIDTLHDLAGGP